MRFEIDGNPDYGDLTVHLEAGESFLAEGGAMSRMSPELEMRSRLLGGLPKAVVRRLVGGESLFVGEYTAPADARGAPSASFSPSQPGTVLHRRLEDDHLILTAGSFLACTPGVELRTRFGGLRAFVSGEGGFFIECSGRGDLFFNAFGGVVERRVDGALTVDTGHVVAFEPSLSYTIGGMGGLKSTLFSGEGLVMKFAGTGTIWLQTRVMPGLVGWLTRYLR